MKKTKESKSKTVVFQLETKPGSMVSVAGSFNNWDSKKDPMKDNQDSGCFKAALALPPGRHEYKFVVNGEWCVDPQCPVSTPNSAGSLNSVILI